MHWRCNWQICSHFYNTWLHTLTEVTVSTTIAYQFCYDNSLTTFSTNYYTIFITGASWINSVFDISTRYTRFNILARKWTIQFVTNHGILRSLYSIIRIHFIILYHMEASFTHVKLRDIECRFHQNKLIRNVHIVHLRNCKIAPENT